MQHVVFRVANKLHSFWRIFYSDYYFHAKKQILNLSTKTILEEWILCWGRDLHPRSPFGRVVYSHVQLLLCHPSWSRRWDSNPWLAVYKTATLPLSYFGIYFLRIIVPNKRIRGNTKAKIKQKPYLLVLLIPDVWFLHC